ncbi:methylenetetrahydrofolate dehydrogenase, partial [Reticulomyxa filosa]
MTRGRVWTSREEEEEEEEKEKWGENITKGYSQRNEKPLIVNGKHLAETVFSKVREQVHEFRQQYDRTPGLAVILIDTESRKDSLLYTQLKHKKAQELDMKSFNYCFPVNNDMSYRDILSL